MDPPSAEASAVEAGPEVALASAVRRRPLPGWISAVAISPLLFAGAQWIGGARDPRLLAGAGLFALIVGLPAFLVARPRTAPVHAGPLGLTVRGVLVPRSEIAEALVLPWPGRRPRVSVRRRGFTLPLHIEVHDDETAERLVRALGLDAVHATAAFRIPSRIVGSSGLLFGVIVSMFAALLLVFVLAHLVGPDALEAFPALWFVLCVLAILPRRLTIGADGLLVTSPFGKQRFIPYGDVRSVDACETVVVRGGGLIKLGFAGPVVKTIGRFGIVVELDGESLEIPMGRGNDENVAMAVERIREAMRADDEAPDDLETALLRPATHDARKWVAYLRSLARGDAGPFRVPITIRRLWEIVENPKGAPVVRAAAAVALSADLDDEGHSRLRVVAEASASPRLRVVLGGVLGERAEDELAAALEEVSVTADEAADHDTSVRAIRS